jgi:hypothetical protein
MKSAKSRSWRASEASDRQTTTNRRGKLNSATGRLPRRSRVSSRESAERSTGAERCSASRFATAVLAASINGSARELADLQGDRGLPERAKVDRRAECAQLRDLGSGNGFASAGIT